MNFTEKHTLHDILAKSANYTESDIKRHIEHYAVAIEKDEILAHLDMYLEDFFGCFRGEEDEDGNDVFEIECEKFRKMLETDKPINEFWGIAEFDDATYIINLPD